MSDVVNRAMSSAAAIEWARSIAPELTAGLALAHGDAKSVAAPWTGDTLHDLRHCTVQDVDAAESAARFAQREWSRTSFAERRSILLRAHSLLLERRRELIDLVQVETGKNRASAFEEVFAIAQAMRHTAVTVERVLSPRFRRSSVPGVVRAMVDHEPKGLVSVVTPWNYPVALAAMDVLPALAAGNAVLQKIDDQTVLSLMSLRRMLLDAGLPAALWQVVTGPGDPVGNAVVDAGDHVSFTGSTATGTRIAERLAPRLVSASLELGGKNPMIVLDDLDPDAAAALAFPACFGSAGQLCVSIERIYVLRPVAEAFIAAFAARIRSARIGPGLDYSIDMGSLTNRSQLDRVQAHVGDAITKGATVVAGGNARPELGPYFHEPTLLTGVSPDMNCFAEETFGPVVAIHVVESVEEAIAAANDSQYGLNAAVLTGSVARGRAVARRIEAGSVNINDGYRASFASIGAPMGGWKRSGMGRRNGPEGILRFVESRTIANPTGILPLPVDGESAARMEPVYLAALRVLAALHFP